MSIDEKLFGCSYPDVLTRAFALYQFGLDRQKTLAEADANLTPDWFEALQSKALAAQALPGLALRQADQHTTVLSRDEAIRQARSLVQDVFFYAKKAYPNTPNASDLFAHHAVTAADDDPAKFNTALQAVAEQVRQRQAQLLTPGGMAQTRIDELLRLAGLAHTGTTSVVAERGEGTVATDQYVAAFNELWTLLVTLREAAQVAFRQDEAQRRLFRLYPDGPEERDLTAPGGTPAAPGRRVVRLDSTLSPKRALSLTLDAPAGPVRVALLRLPADAPAPGLLLETTPDRHPARVPAAHLGPEGAQYLLLENPHPDKASLQVRVLPVGE